MRLGFGLSTIALAASLAAPALAVDLNVISKVEVKNEGSAILVTIEGSRPPSFTTFSMADPPRFVIDISESQFQNVPEDVVVGDDTINLVKNLSYGSGETSIARVMIAFNREVDPPDVQTVVTSLVVRIPRPTGGANVAAAQPAAPSARAEAEARARAEAEAQARAEAEAKARAEAEAKARAEAEARQAAAPPPAGAGAAGSLAGGAAIAGGAAVAGGAAAVGPGQKAPEEQSALAAERARQDKENQELLAWREAQKRAEAEAAAKKKEQESQIQVQRLGEQGRQQGEAGARAQAEPAPEAGAQASVAAPAAPLPAAPEPPPAAAPVQAEAPRVAAEPPPAEAHPVAVAPPATEAPAAAVAPPAAEAPPVAAEPPAAPAPQEKEQLAAVDRRPAPERLVPERLVTPSKPRQVREIGFQQLPEVSRVFVRLSDAPSFQITEVGENLIQVELANTRVKRHNDTRFLDTSFFPSPVAMVTPKRQGTSYLVEIRLRQRVPYQQKVEGDMLAIDFERPASMRGQPAPAAPAASEAPPGSAAPEAPAGSAAPEAAPAEPPAPEAPGQEPARQGN
jgi:hypothetical protein